MEQRVSLITLGVDDLERARAFYEDGMGWKRTGNEESVVFFQLPAIILGLYSRRALAEEAGFDPDSGKGFGAMSIAYNARNRADVDAVLSEAEQAGGKVTAPAKEVFWGGYSGYFTDPDGHLWEVAHNPFWTMTDEGHVLIPPVECA